MNTLNVIAAPGLKVPKQGAPRSYITAAEACAVPASAYYRRRIADGDLIEVNDSGAPLASSAPATKSKKGA